MTHRFFICRFNEDKFYYSCKNFFATHTCMNFAIDFVYITQSYLHCAKRIRTVDIVSLGRNGLDLDPIRQQTPYLNIESIRYFE